MVVPKSFHPSLGIPLIITVIVEGCWCCPTTHSFHPSLGIPLIITLAKVWALHRFDGFPSLFRDSSDHHLKKLGGERRR